MRDPSIHITQSCFEKLLSDLSVENFPIDKFFVLAKQEAVNSRIIALTNNKNIKKVNNISLASVGNANLAADILYSIQIKLKHRGVKKISELDTNRWSMAKKLAEVCNIFCKDFNLETRYGYIKYMELGFSRMGKDLKNYLPRLISMSQNISETYQALKVLQEDSDRELTDKIYQYYISVIAEKTGLSMSYDNQPDIYVNFVNLKDYLVSNDINYEDWIDSQFEALEWCNGIPEPNKLLGDKAYSYYVKFMYKNQNVKTNSPTKLSGSLWDQIK